MRGGGGGGTEEGGRCFLSSYLVLRRCSLKNRKIGSSVPLSSILSGKKEVVSAIGPVRPNKPAKDHPWRRFRFGTPKAISVLERVTGELG